jgi:hypothetical protein
MSTATKSKPLKSTVQKSQLPDTPTANKLTIVTPEQHQKAIAEATAQGSETVFASWSEVKKNFGCNNAWIQSLAALYSLPIIENDRATLVSVPGINLILNTAVELHADPIEWEPSKVVEDIKRELREQVLAKETARIATLLDM